MADTVQTKPCLNHPSFKAHWAPNPSTERGDNFHLGTHPKEPTRIIYPSGKFIIVRDISNPADTFVYRGHNAKTTVAKFSPNGFWVASADIMGKVRIWAWDNPEHQLKIEVIGLGGAIKDLAWGPESKRIVVCGAGSGMNARAFMWDTGSNLGEVVGHAKRVISCDYRPKRPYRVITASEDSRTIFYQGPPFKMHHSNNDQHTNFINCVRFSPDGAKIATCSSDKKIWLYDGTTGEALTQIGTDPSNAHTGSIYSLAWSADSASIATASADKTVRLWDAESGELKHKWTFGSGGVGDMQVAVVFCGDDRFVSVSLTGDLNVLELDKTAPAVVHQAHQGAITAMTPTPVPAPGGNGGSILVTGSFDGVLCAWDPETGLSRRCCGGKAAPVSGACHGNKVSGIAACSAGLVSVGWDDTLRLAPAGADGNVPVFTDSVGTTGQPCGVAANASSELVAVATSQAVMLLRGVNPVASAPAGYTPSSVAMSPASDEVAVGSKEGSIHIYSISGGDELKETAVISGHRGEVTSVAYSPSGGLLAAGDSAREVMVWRTAGGSWEPEVQGLWQFHTARVTCLAWSPDGSYVASGGVDQNVFVWKPSKPRRRVQYPFANKDGVGGLAWLSDGELASAGGDHCVATWNVAQDLGVFDD